MRKTENTNIIDLRNANKHELLMLSKLLLNLQALLSMHGLKIQIKRNKSNCVQKHTTFNLTTHR